MDRGDRITGGNFGQIATQQKKEIEPPFEIEGNEDEVTVPILVRQLDFPAVGNMSVQLDGLGLRRKQKLFDLFWTPGWNIEYLISKTRSPISEVNASLRVENGGFGLFGQIHN